MNEAFCCVNVIGNLLFRGYRKYQGWNPVALKFRLYQVGKGLALAHSQSVRLVSTVGFLFLLWRVITELFNEKFRAGCGLCPAVHCGPYSASSVSAGLVLLLLLVRHKAVRARWRCESEITAILWWTAFQFFRWARLVRPFRHASTTTSLSSSSRFKAAGNLPLCMIGIRKLGMPEIRFKFWWETWIILDQNLEYYCWW